MTTQQSIHPLRQFALEQLAFLEKEVEKLIERKETRQEVIECLLQLVYSLTELGVGQELLSRLKEYHREVQGINHKPFFPQM